MPVPQGPGNQITFSANPGNAVIPTPIIASTSFALRPLPDTLTVITATAAGTVTITLPKINSQYAPVGRRVTIRKADADANLVSIATTGGDTIDAGASPFNAALPAGALNTVTLQATSATNWDLVSNSVKVI